MKRFLIFIFLIIISKQFVGQNHYHRFESIDIQHYIFEIHLNDSTNCIEGKTNISAKFLKSSKNLVLDLVGKNDSTNTGMVVSAVKIEEKPVHFNHKNNQIQIYLENTVNSEEIINIEIEYSGKASDGLIASKNKYGNRTFFGDNWPNRARNWLPTVDHPSDKATLEFKVFTPEKYDIISNGILVEEKYFSGGIKFSHWKEKVAISTKLMVIGVARFSTLHNGNFNGIPISSLVFPENKDEGFTDFEEVIKPLEFFSEFIGTYSYEKLAHVQSKTRYGGMENASCIFYAEKAITGNKQIEKLITHETAHQWFGNSVTEQNWHHIWLSEGFATYLTHLYILHFYGEESFREGLINDRKRVIDFADKKLTSVIDTTIKNYNNLLNANSYQKASWFLHMLRTKIGEEMFQQSLKEFYSDFRDSTALTSDFRKIAEKNSGQNLDIFFDQWLYQPGFPVLEVKWKQKKNNKIKLKIRQVQDQFIFTFPLEIEFQPEMGNPEYKMVEINKKKKTFKISGNQKIESIYLDPNVNLLFNEL